MNNLSHWKYNGQIVETPPEGAKGFVYRITNKSNGKMYIGKKALYSTRRLKPLKGKTKRRVVTKESDWKTYCSSSKELIGEIAFNGKENYEFEIISFHDNKTEMNYQELRIQILEDVLDAINPKTGERLYYNANIVSRYYPSEKYGATRRSLCEDYGLNVPDPIHIP